MQPALNALPHWNAPVCLEMTIFAAEAGSQAALSAAVARLAEHKVDAVITSTSLIFNLRTQLLALTNARRLPVVAHRAELADAGALLTYGAALSEQVRLAATLVDKLLRGSSPSTTPVEQPTKFELVVNRKAARALGVEVPRSVLLRADRIIE